MVCNYYSLTRAAYPIDGMDLGDIVEPPAPRNLRLDNSSTPTLINITWDRSEGISPAIVAYQLTYSLSRLNGSSSSDEVLVRSVCCCMCSICYG